MDPKKICGAMYAFWAVVLICGPMLSWASFIAENPFFYTGGVVPKHEETNGAKNSGKEKK